MLSFDEFRAELAEAFGTEATDLTAHTDFLHDLAFDSIRMLQLGLFFEEHGVAMPTELAWEIRTVGAAYDYYADAVAAGGGQVGQASR